MELQNQLLNKKQEAIHLKELDTFKSRLYTNLTHEFRTPLTVMLGMVEKGRLDLRNGKLGDSQAGQTMLSNFKVIERNGEQLLRLINQLLDLSKMEDGSFKLQLQCGDIVSFLRYLISDFEGLAESKNLTLTFSSDSESLEMDYDPEQVQMIMANLLSNALKFTPAGGEVKVSVLSPQSAVHSQQSTVGSPQSPDRTANCELRTAN